MDRPKDEQSAIGGELAAVMILVGNGTALTIAQRQAVRNNLCWCGGDCEICRASIRGVNTGFEAGYSAALEHERGKRTAETIDVVLHCPRCKFQHIDEADPMTCETCGLSGENECICDVFNPWLNPPHKSHRCLSCNIVWRPADVPTNGVAKAQTVGGNDTKDFGINPNEDAPYAAPGKENSDA